THTSVLLPPPAHVSLLFFQPYVDHRPLHSFPTRRSSDLFKTCFHQTTQTTTKYGLLTKQVCFCFFLERSFKYTSSCCTDSSYIRKCYFCCFSSIILKYTI